ncbi:MAG: S46 family peptidase [Flavisolibacter sp.]
MKKILFFLLLVVSKFSFADEGMWLPQLLQLLNEKQMKSLGMKINASDIYNINKGSLKDAVVSFGGFCTGEVISSQGLVLTNHHCGFDAIQNHSTVEKNYLRDGFWAMNRGEELPNPGLFVTFIVRIDDVTKQVLNGVTAGMSESERQSAIDKNINALKPTVKKEETQDFFVRPFFDGNKYYLFVTETYRDIRLVGAPPSSIGNFGHDTDNWMWPRHTGDFSMFRIYASKDNKPAAYSPDNVPYKPKRSLSISLDGMKEGDFTMVFGFPGRTWEYLPAVAVEQIVTVNDPAKIAIREKALSVLDPLMRQDEATKIQYASKYAGIQNAYKKWQGEVLGIQRTHALDSIRAYEAVFQKRVNANPTWKSKYGNLLNELNAAYKELEPLGLSRDIHSEVINRIELFSIAAELNRLKMALQRNGEAGLNQQLSISKSRLQDFYKEYNPAVDKKMMAALLEVYFTMQDHQKLSPAMRSYLEKADHNYDKLAAQLYDDTDLDDEKEVMEEMNDDAKDFVEDLGDDKVFELLQQLNSHFSENTLRPLNEVQNRINLLQRTYMQAQMDVFKEKTFYPDANSTLRVTYGKVREYDPRDGVTYEPQTYLKGVIEKYKPGDYEFDLPQRLIDLYKAKDFGPYGEKGKMPVNFIATNHTTGGNSGSPVLDAWGNLIGLNFDRVWEGTMSDLYYDPSICRNIMVDARYILFIIDKYAGATHLVKEMNLVHPKTAPKKAVKK